MTEPRIAIVTVSYYHHEDTVECIRSIKATGEPVRVIVVDNGSQPNPRDSFRQWFPDVVFLRSEENLGVAGGYNIGLRYALEQEFDYILMLNNDTVVTPTFLRPLLQAMERDPKVAIAGGKIYYHSQPDRIWFAGGRYNRLTGRVSHIGMLQRDDEIAHPASDVDFISGCFALFRTSALKKVGLFDESLFAYMEDIDLNLRLKQAGYKLAYVPEAFIYHKVSTTSKVDSPFYLYFNMRNRLIVLKKHNSVLELAPALPYLTFYYTRQLVRLAFKWHYWKGARAVLLGIVDGLRGYTGKMGKGRLESL
jgi:hypothetical protein